MICEVVAIGTELLLGPSVDTNSAWIGERLAENGIDSHFHTVVGDNHERMVEALRVALSRSDAVVVTGGLGPTQDDITREAIAEVMGVPLFRDDAVAHRIRLMFEARGRSMAASNLRQADRPQGSAVIEQRRGTAPGLICPVASRDRSGDETDKVIYAVPGVPWEMQDMVQRAVLPDLRRRSGASAVIVSRTLRTWGESESALAEMVAPRFTVLEKGAVGVTLAFLAHGIEGIHVRITAKADSAAKAGELLDAEEAELRALLGPLIFGTDDQTIEVAVANLLLSRELSLAVAESVTGGLIASRLTAVPGGSSWFRGGIVSYASDVKYSVLDVPEGPVVTPSAALAMAEGVRRLMDSDIGLGITGVAGPGQQEGQPVGLVHAALVLPDRPAHPIELRLSGSRERIRDFACINVLDALRRQLLHAGP